MNNEMKEVNLEELEGTAGGAGTNYIIYIVVKGDNLTRIAKRYGVTVKQLVAWNGIATLLIVPFAFLSGEYPSCRRLRTALQWFHCF